MEFGLINFKQGIEIFYFKLIQKIEEEKLMEVKEIEECKKHIIDQIKKFDNTIGNVKY